MLDRNVITGTPTTVEADRARLHALENAYCSYGDTVHYTEFPKIFERCEGSFMYDDEDRPFLDLQMWYSAVNFGYANLRLNGAMRRQLDRLPPASICTARRSSSPPRSPSARRSASAARAACISTSAARRRSRIR